MKDTDDMRECFDNLDVDVKLCKDCKHFSSKNKECWRKRKSKSTINLVDGKVFNTGFYGELTCSSERYPPQPRTPNGKIEGDFCGEEGKYFEPKTSTTGEG